VLDSKFLAVGLEQGSSGAVLVHSFGIPGCVALGATAQEALDAYATAFSEWLNFREAVGMPIPPREMELEIAVDEWVQSDAEVERGESDVCFERDLAPLADREINEGLYALGDLRGRLLRALRDVPRAEFDTRTVGVLTLRRILDELARAQWWTLTRLGASPLAEVPEQPVARLDTAMALVVQQFTGLARTERDRVIEIDGEDWTPRKVMRRLLWVEWSLGRSARIALHEEVAG
jgi:predicted RNase H-like HicB family nuclease